LLLITLAKSAAFIKNTLKAKQKIIVSAMIFLL
jgi:hypothetical protein